MEDLSFGENNRVLVLGATGFVGKRLVQELAGRNAKLRVLARNPRQASSLFGGYRDIEIVKGDVVTGDGLAEALKGIHSTYYLIHSLGGRSLYRTTEYVEKDLKAARGFVAAAEAEAVRRVIYLGGLGEAGDDLSDHLRSRAEVAGALASSKRVSATILRAAVIIGAGGASFEMLRYLVERLPVMICPRWIETRIQPVAIKDVIAYLAGCLYNPATAAQTFDLCGPEIFTYREMMQRYAEIRGLTRRFIIPVPVLTPLLSAYWVDLVTPIPSGLAHPLIEGLKNEVVCRDARIRTYVPVEPTSFEKAVKTAIAEEKEGPGLTGW